MATAFGALAASPPWIDGLQHTGPRTCVTNANAYAANVRSDLVRETWRAPGLSRITLGEFGPITPSTHERCRSF
ncbi:MAG: hypothetical protein F2840_17590 [Actinobacteria bacterium]|uniref:Unannotated protein n=1 Tax=freshwater metagenome TaxID=449393 RepID=A0A6J7M0U2_9ZZZZ|nr:hypothetical protein [Actinomycetota bacterium]